MRQSLVTLVKFLLFGPLNDRVNDIPILMSKYEMHLPHH